MARTNNSDEVLIDVDQIGKKFCLSLKKSLLYGAKDIAHAINPFRSPDDLKDKKRMELRKDEFWAIQNVSFQLRRGECLGLIGHNGAGKSTLLKILNGLIKPDTGKIIIRGRVCALIELSAGFNNILTGRENIYNQGALLGLSNREITEQLDEIIEFSELGEFIDMPVQNYSSGMKVRLGFAVAIQVKPDILLLDEILAVGDTAFRFKCLNAMGRLLERSAVIFVSHSISQIQRVCTTIGLLKKGQLVYNGNDINKGINEYHKSINKIGTQTSGVNRIQIRSTKLTNLNSRENSRTEIDAVQGDCLLFALGLENASDVSGFELSLVLWNTDMYPIATLLSNELVDHVFKFTADPFLEIEIELSGITLAAGKYHVSMHIRECNAHQTYMRVDNLFAINVTGVIAGNTSILIPSNTKAVPSISIG